MIAKKINVQGLVQGVFFRSSTKQKADELGIRGTVRNCKRHGDIVRIHAEGDEEAMKQFIEWCHEGPDTAEVESIEVLDDKEARSNTFEITH